MVRRRAFNYELLPNGAMPPLNPPRSNAIRIRGARQNNLKNLDLDLPLNELIVVTGVSGSGKSSLVFDTLYAEGQRRYVETFSPYARQFLDRMDKPLVDRIDGIPPAIAIDQTNPVRTSRSTVGTMTELNDHLKLLFARVAVLHCRGCGRPVRRDTPETIRAELEARSRAAGDPRLLLTFPVTVPKNFSEAEIKALLAGQGYTRIHEQRGGTLQVVQDRFKWSTVDPARAGDAIEAALKVGQGRLDVYSQGEAGQVEPAQTAPGRGDSRPSTGGRNSNSDPGRGPNGGTTPSWRFSTDLHCPDCDISYKDPSPSTFSFNSPLGACETCRGFGRVIGVDYGLVIPDGTLSLRGGAIKPWQTESYKECQADLLKFARRRSIPIDTPWRDLTEAQRNWVLDGEGEWTKNIWYGVKRFFAWLETRAYKMHIRVLLSRYRSYTECPSCHGARLKPEALLWRVGSPGLNVREMMLLPIDQCRHFFATLVLPAPLDDAADLLLREIRARLKYLTDVGLGYLDLDRQSRTLSGGEVQRINLTTALGTSLVSTLFVLDEPSIGLHPRDVGRIVGVMQRLRDAGNTLVVVEHDPKVMEAADRVLDIGPGPGEHGGEIVFYGPVAELARAEGSLTADYLFRRKRVEIPPAAHERGGSRAARSGGASLARDRSSGPALDSGSGPALDHGSSPALDHGSSPALDHGSDLVRDRRVPSTRRDAVRPDAAALANVLRLAGAAEHNLKNIDVEIPLQRLVCVTGVSGSGKSTLVHDVLYPALLRAKGKPTENPGPYRALDGIDRIDDVIMVDQSRIGRTTRSNPASYVGAFDAIRHLFAKLPQALERKYTAGTFSFNAGNGRCPACGGNGFEHVEMQFLSDVYLRCPDCDGRRYRAEILECKLPRTGFPPRSIADVLDLTVSEALKFFAGDSEVCLRLAPLADVGLDYLRLGQPVPTLSGGEAQRLKLAGHLAENAMREHAARKRRPSAQKSQRRTNGAGDQRLGLRPERGSLFLFDEPTTGLHFDDVAKLLRAFRRLIDAGHSLLVIEHNLDVVRAADWIIDLGPEGGDAGGAVVCVGTPDEVMRVVASHTGRALLEAENPAAFGNAVNAVEDSENHSYRVAASTAIEIRGAREHNLKNVDVNLGRNQFTVITGVSGSGKSSLAFDILFAEGQRRYLESLNAYARQFVQPASRPDVDAIFGIPPTVAIEQRTSRGGRKSTVATLTEIYHFLRLLYVKLGVQYCPVCSAAIEPQSPDAIAARLLKEYRGEKITLLAPLVVARKGLYTALAKWARGKGFTELRVDGSLIPTAKWPRLDRFIEHSIELPVATLVVNAAHETELRQALAMALEHGRGVVHVAKANSKANSNPSSNAAGAPAVLSTKRACPNCGTGFPELDPRLFSFNSRHGWCKSCFGTGSEMPEFDAEQSGEESKWREDDDSAALACPECNGERLNPVARHVLFRSMSIAALTALPVQEFQNTLSAIKLLGRERDIARDLLAELGTRTAFLRDVGLGYLQLNRAAPTLSGGEAQRIRLAAQLGSNLQGVCYVLDEPTIGLHPRDNATLLDTLDRLRAKGNTLVVVEHDEDTIRRADHVIDLGPGAGTRGGRLVAEGNAAELARLANSATGRCLANPYQHSRSRRRPIDRDTPSIEVRGATLHNLREVAARIPLSRLSVITGVSGSGKSSLARDVLLGNLKRLLSRPNRSDRAQSSARAQPPNRAQPSGRARPSDRVPPPRELVKGCESITGWESISRVLEVDQTPIGKTPRSCPATYIGFWDSIRRLYAETTDARIRGFTASRFSFNTAGGRCEACEGQGMQRIEMNFLPDVQVLCDVCGGRRFNQETLSILFKGRSIGETLAMSVEDAVEFFAAQRSVQHPLSLLADVGLGYLSLGQPSPTLSGGESQRIKLVAELAKVRTDALGVDIARREGQHTLYVLDEPTVGLHMADVEKLVKVLQRLVDAGNTVVVIEHNLDIMAEADWIVDLGPEGGAGGGRIVAQGMPEAIVRKPNKSHTARILGKFLAERGVP
jgi:excinuclease ABC subunit A